MRPERVEDTDWLPLLWPTLVGGCLRLYQLPQQILVDDEWHMVHKLRGSAAFTSVVGEFGLNDHSIGMSALTWVVMHLTAADELLIRMPSVVAGLLLLVVVPVLSRPLIGRDTSIVVAWFLAVSPLLCFFARTARPYALTTLLVSIATLRLYAWVRGGSRRAAGSYAASAAVAPIVHLPALPAVLAPLGFMLLARLHRPAARLRSARQFVGLLVLTLLPMAALLIVPILSSGTQVLARLDADSLRLDTIPGTVELLAGTCHWPVIAVLAVLGGIGLVAVQRRSTLLASYLVFVIAIQIATIGISGATAVHVPVVAARYIGVVLPLVLIFPAAGLTDVVRRVGLFRRHLSATALGAAVAAGLFWIGPLRWIYAYPNNFTNHASYQADYKPGRYFERFRPHDVSTFYTDVLGKRAPADMTIVEAPWYFYFHSFAYYQRIHRQRVLIGFVEGSSDTPRVGEISLHDRHITLRNAVDLSDTAGMRRHHVELIVLHKNLLTETRWPTGVTEVAIDMDPWIARYRLAFGPPAFEDSQIVVFSLPQQDPLATKVNAGQRVAFGP